MRLIDADALQKKISALCEKNKELIDRWFTNIVDDEIENAPTIDAVKHGRWVKRTDENCWWYECSECGDYPMKNVYGHEKLSAYCPNCGARMVRGEEE